MRIRENRAELTGRLVDRPEHDTPSTLRGSPSAGWDDLYLEVTACDDVAGYPNLLHDATGRVLAVRTPVADIADLAIGDSVVVRASRAAPDLAVADRGSVRRR